MQMDLHKPKTACTAMNISISVVLVYRILQKNRPTLFLHLAIHQYHRHLKITWEFASPVPRTIHSPESFILDDGQTGCVDLSVFTNCKKLTPLWFLFFHTLEEFSVPFWDFSSIWPYVKFEMNTMP